MTSTTLIAQAQQAMNAGSCLQAALLPMAVIAIFYFLVLRPQQKQLQEAQRFRDSLKADDQVITTSGIYGRIVELEADRVTLEVSTNPKVRIQVARAHIGQRVTTGKDNSEETKK